MNQLQAVALNEGLRCKKRLWRERGRQPLESFRLAPWASRRRRDLLELMDRLNPTITELTLEHREGAERFYRDLAVQGMKVRVGVEASGHARWFERLLAELQFELWIGDAAEMGSKRVRADRALLYGPSNLA